MFSEWGRKLWEGLIRQVGVNKVLRVINTYMHAYIPLREKRHVGISSSLSCEKNIYSNVKTIE